MKPTTKQLVEQQVNRKRKPETRTNKPINLKKIQRSKIINNFIKSANTECGYGFFEFEKIDGNNSEQDVVDYAMKLSKSQIRQWERYGVVPAEFIKFLKDLDVIPENIEIPKSERTIEGLADLLFQIPYKNKVACGLGDHLREQILKDLIPDMKVMFGSGEKFNNDLYKLRNQLSLDKRQGYRRSAKKEVMKHMTV